MGFKQTTPIQSESIPEIMLGSDVIGQASTGTGKTAAFLITLFERMLRNKTSPHNKALIIAPTRELAIQIHSDDVFAYLKGVFYWDWHASHPMFLPVMACGWRPPEPPVGYPVISEVLYNPLGAGEGDEWVEIFNPTNQTVDLTSWYLGDVDSSGEFGSGR